MYLNTTQKYLFVLSLSTAYVLVLSLFSVYEGIQSIAAPLYRGDFTNGSPINIFYYQSHLFFANIYMKMYSMNPKWYWYECFMFGFIAISLSVIFWEIIQNRFGNQFKIIAILTVLVISSGFILVLDYTRVSFFLGIASTVILVFGKYKQSTKSILSAAFITTCILTRPETGVFILLIQIVAILITAPNKKPYIAPLLINVLIVTTIMGTIAYETLTTTSFIKQMEPDLSYQLLDRKNIVPLASMKNAVDSAKYFAATNMITDPSYTTIDFLRSLIKENSYWGLNKILINRCFDILFEHLQISLRYVVLYFLTLLCCILFANRQILLRLIYFHFFFWLVLVGVIYFIKMEIWIFESMMILMIVFSVLYTSSSYLVYRVGGKIALLFLFPAMTYFICYQLVYTNELMDFTRKNKQFANVINKKYQDKILIPSQDKLIHMVCCTRPYEMADYKSFFRVYLFECDMLYLEPEYNKYLHKECKCNTQDFTGFLDFLKSKKEEVVIISSYERMNAINQYCSVVRNKYYPVIAIDSIPYNDEKAIVFKFE